MITVARQGKYFFFREGNEVINIFMFSLKLVVIEDYSAST